jgi:hypothetical protein
MPLKTSFDGRSVGDQLTLRTIMRDVLQLLKPTSHGGPQIAMETRFGKATQPEDLAIRDPLTAQVESFHPHLHSRVRVLEPPIA